jgi:tRNA 2-thiouridine synthesizing protein E
MLDINKLINDEGAYRGDPEGFLADLPEWSDEIAMELAKQEGITLTADHWRVVRYLRDFYRAHGPLVNAREALCCLEQDLGGDEEGKKWLYRLFPGGPVRQGGKIAGLPEFAYTVDRSFGSIH